MAEGENGSRQAGVLFRGVVIETGVAKPAGGSIFGARR